MSEKIYFHLLLFCGILWQGIFATFSYEDNRVSSDFLVRKRRVINHLPDGRNPTRIEAANFIVKIRENNRANCAGVILSHYTVLTAALCIQKHILQYKILSGAAYDNRCNVHSLTSKEEYYGSLPHQPIDGIAVVTVDPLFEFTFKTGSINLNLLPALPHSMVTVFGWGYMYRIRPGPESQMRLHSITLPLMHHEVCENIYRSNFINLHGQMQRGLVVTEKHICTYCEHQYCAYSDEGAPLVHNNLLVGIHVWKGEFTDRMNPDVYINLQRHDYVEWIIQHTLLM